MLKRYMHKRERHFAMLNDNRIVRPFEWGAEFVAENINGETGNGRQPAILAEYARQMAANSDEHFSVPDITDFKLEGARLKWTSGVNTPTPENNTAYAAYFPNGKNKRAAVVILPHWNARAGSYFDLCRFFNKVGISALRLTLPYHEERMPPELERADHLVSPNVGRTLQSVRQSVVDTRSAVRWLKECGYQRIGVVGTSIGSCVAFLAFVHEANISAAVFNHVSGYMADVVWHGLSTYHVRDGFADHIGLEELRQYWLPLSPMAYMKKLAEQPHRPQRYIYTLYDLSFPVELSRQTIEALRLHNIRHSKVALPCGHYTLGEKPWVYLDGYKIIRFLHKHLK